MPKQLVKANKEVRLFKSKGVVMFLRVSRNTSTGKQLQEKNENFDCSLLLPGTGLFGSQLYPDPPNERCHCQCHQESTWTSSSPAQTW